MLQSTGVGGLGTVKNALPGIACLVEGGKAVVIHLSHWLFMINRTYEGAYEERTL